MHYLTGLPNISAAAFYLSHKIKSGAASYCLFACKSEEELEELAAALAAFPPEGAQVVIAGDDKPTLYSALYEIYRSPRPLLLGATYEALQTPLPGKKDFAQKIIPIQVSQTTARADLLARLEAAGYARTDYTEKQGEYAVRGSVVDIFNINSALPCRVYFSGNTVSTISLFDIETQNTKTNLGEIDIIPLDFGEQKSSFKNWAKDFDFYLFNPAPGYEPDFEGTLHTITFLNAPGAADCGLRPNISLNGDLKLFDAEAGKLLTAGYKTIFSCLNRGEAERMQEVFADYAALRRLPITITPLMVGFSSPADKIAYFTSGEALGRVYRSSALIKKFDNSQAKRVRFKELETGDYIVHQEHGIGRYSGMETLDNDGAPIDCLVIEFKRGERLYVPVADFRKIQKYIGLKGKAPKISSLSGGTWKEVKKRVKEDAQKTAKEILRMEALRQANKAQNLLGNERLEREFADSFPYQQTEDQTKAISEITADILQERPMDRVLVGDVGFGKTEVAMRAALKAALSGVQTLILVPTTVLAAQHYKTFTARLAGFPARIAMMSRFQTKKEQKQTAADIKNGVVDIAIGTHRLLSKDIEFKNLGLCIIDEEHRFGVKQKEKIKAKSLGVHTLMLSATPIPRTLNQSLSSLRDMSLIETAPHGRMPIKTRVLPYNDEIIINAVHDELERGGQIFYVYNKVESMSAKLAYLQNLLPTARITMAHGQMDDEILEQTLWDFYNKKYDILLASTIIESGLDVTNANTLIVENAQDFGLAQLYQLRGRIGRGDAKAYAYLLHPDWMLKKPKEEDFAFDSFYGKIKKQQKSTTEEAQKRLQAIMELSDLGSGFKLALRDLEIRGGGELLGIRQHGYVNAVGLSLYCDLVASEVKKLKGNYEPKALLAAVNLRVPAYIPPDYVPSDSERLRYYKELMAADAAQKQQILRIMQDLSGPAPLELLNLAEIMQISQDAGKLSIRAVEGGDGFIEFYFTRAFKIPQESVGQLLAKFPGAIKFLPAQNGDGLRIYRRANNPLENAKYLLAALGGLLAR